MYCNTIPSAARFLCHNTLQCIVIQTSTIQPQYNRRLAIQFTHCTPKLQYTSPIAIQFSSHSTLLLQYNSNSLAHLQYTSYCNTNLPNLHSQSLSHNTIHSIAIQYPLLQPLLVTIQSVYCYPIPLPRLLYCNTMLAHCNTNHPTTHPGLQYKFSITIQLGSSPNQSLHQIFFFRFSLLLLLIFFISSYWKMPKKIHIYIFFSHTCYWKNT